MHVRRCILEARAESVLGVSRRNSVWLQTQYVGLHFSIGTARPPPKRTSLSPGKSPRHALPLPTFCIHVPSACATRTRTGSPLPAQLLGPLTSPRPLSCRVAGIECRYVVAGGRTGRSQQNVRGRSHQIDQGSEHVLRSGRTVASREPVSPHNGAPQAATIFILHLHTKQQWHLPPYNLFNERAGHPALPSHVRRQNAYE